MEPIQSETVQRAGAKGNGGERDKGANERSALKGLRSGNNIRAGILLPEGLYLIMARCSLYRNYISGGLGRSFVRKAGMCSRNFGMWDSQNVNGRVRKILGTGWMSGL